MNLFRACKLLIVGARGGTNIGGCFERASLELGIDVKLLEISQAMDAPKWLRRFNWHLRGHRPTHLNRFSSECVRLCQEWSPSLVVATGGVPLNAEALRGVGTLGIPVVSYSTDDPWNPTQASRWLFRALPEYAMIFSARRANMEDFRELGCRDVRYLPFAYDPKLHFKEQPSAIPDGFDCDVLFIGGADKDRTPFCNAIIDAGMKLALYGDYWDRFPNLRSSFRGYADVSTSRIATKAARLCLILARRANRDGHTMRSFEAAAMGGCLLVEDTLEHRDIFGDGVVYFDSITKMVEQAQWLLSRPAQRQQLAATVHQCIITGTHTYADRLRTILTSVVKGAIPA